MITKFTNGTLEIELGHGTIKLVPGIMPKTGEKTLAFASCAKHEVGEQFHDDVGKTQAEIEGVAVSILFKSDRDIFNLIRVLTEMALSKLPAKSEALRGAKGEKE